MNIPFDIVKGTGPIIMNPVRSMEDIKTITPLEPEKSVPFVGEALGLLRQEVGNNATVLGFVGAPFTLASYIVEGGTSTHYKVIKKMAFDSPQVYHALLVGAVSPFDNSRSHPRMRVCYSRLFSTEVNKFTAVYISLVKFRLKTDWELNAALKSCGGVVRVNERMDQWTK